MYCIGCQCCHSLPPTYQHTTHRREERLAAQIARSKEMRQESFTRGREEFLASAITMATGGGSGGSSHERGERERERSHSMFGRVPLVSTCVPW
jgi:hypothetical protein